MASALAAGDGEEYAKLLMSAPLSVPELPEPGTEPAREVAELLPPGTAYVLAYTSVSALAFALGDLAAGYQQLDFAALRQRWPDPGHQLAVNPGTPIAAFLPPQAVAEVAAGDRSLVPIEDLQRAMVDEAHTQIRRACLVELGGSLGSGAEPGADPAAAPAGALEVALQAAVDREDGEAFLSALLAAQVILPTESPVPGPERIYDDGFPWRRTGSEQAPSIPVFGSAAALESTMAGDPPRIEVDFLDVLANWPDEAYALCFNPGRPTELILSGSTVLDLLEDMAGDVARD